MNKVNLFLFIVLILGFKTIRAENNQFYKIYINEIDCKTNKISKNLLADIKIFHERKLSEIYNFRTINYKSQADFLFTPSILCIQESCVITIEVYDKNKKFISEFENIFSLGNSKSLLNATINNIKKINDLITKNYSLYENNNIIKNNHLRVIKKDKWVSNRNYEKKGRVVYKDNLNIKHSDDKLSFTYTHKKIEEVVKPVDSIWLTSVSLDGSFFLSDMFDMFGAGVLIGRRFINPSGDFPGLEGGQASGLDLTMTLGLRVISMKMKTLDIPSYNYEGYEAPESSSSDSESDTNISISGGFSIGYSSMNFKPVNSFDEEQKGTGWIIGINISYIYLVSKEGRFSFAPIFGYQFLKFNPGTSKLSIFKIMGMIIPIGGFGASLNLTWEF